MPKDTSIWKFLAPTKLKVIIFFVLGILGFVSMVYGSQLLYSCYPPLDVNPIWWSASAIRDIVIDYVFKDVQNPFGAVIFVIPLLIFWLFLLIMFHYIVSCSICQIITSSKKDKFTIISGLIIVIMIVILINNSIICYNNREIPLDSFATPIERAEYVCKDRCNDYITYDYFTLYQNATSGKYVCTCYDNNNLMIKGLLISDDGEYYFIN